MIWNIWRESSWPQGMYKSGKDKVIIQTWENNRIGFVKINCFFFSRTNANSGTCAKMTSVVWVSVCVPRKVHSAMSGTLDDLLELKCSSNWILTGSSDRFPSLKNQLSTPGSSHPGRSTLTVCLWNMCVCIWWRLRLSNVCVWKFECYEKFKVFGFFPHRRFQQIRKTEI